MDSKPFFRIVLIEPEIPQNTGNVGRTCVATLCELHLVGPMGFEISDKNLKRAGLDYWQHLNWYQYQTLDQWLSMVANPERVFLFSTKAKKSLYSAEFQRGDWLVFGKETKGLSPPWVQEVGDRALMIPQPGPVRSLNLATSVAIAAYEGLRQLGI
ncbi:MAG: tRNA (cytidine(34)-2'-O)-methyltransferase [Bdellovibrionaceae bacterium]|nr:tRNA (cytidine(34)-2'-O)-methyltransferase [Pseudobdellovibrionaceae bacterium]